jgi:glycerate-2-kinase
MDMIRNLADLATTEQRKQVLEIISAGLQAIQPAEVLTGNFAISNRLLCIKERKFELRPDARLFLLGIGKGAAGICRHIEEVLGEDLTEGYAIDVVEASFSRVHYMTGTHPLPSPENLAFTQMVLEKFAGLSAQDLVLVVICGGGSAIFEAPAKVGLGTLIALNKALLMSGATISEINVVRKHLSTVKGGGLAKALYPAAVVSLIFSDVPGNDLSVIASGPTVKDPTSLSYAKEILAKYNIAEQVSLAPDDFIETPQADRYFANVTNIVMASNQTALGAMMEKARILGREAFLYSDRLQGDALEIGKTLLARTGSGSVLLAGGETTLTVRGHGRGGRNQALVLAALPFLKEGDLIASIDSDGVDFYHFAGALADASTKEKAVLLGIDPQRYLEDDNSYEFFAATGDGIYTGKLDSNVADLIAIMKA